MVLVAVGQICSTATRSHNLAQCQSLVRKAVAAGAKALFLPEASEYITSSAPEAVSLVRPESSNPFVLGLQDEARTTGLPISVGIHTPSAGGEKVRNTLIWINGEGKITARYDKLHMFDIDLSASGGPVVKESDFVTAGDAVVPPVDTPLGRVGLAICFDVRFPEVALRLRRLGAQVLTYASAFTVPTGQAHWEALLRGRAIESQAYVVAPAQCGRHNEKRMSYGDSMVVAPWGEVVGRLERVESVGEEEARWEKGGEAAAREPQLLTVDLDLGLVEKARRDVPLLRRTDVYPEV